MNFKNFGTNILKKKGKDDTKNRRIHVITTCWKQKSYQFILAPQVLSDVSLMKANNGHWVCSPTFTCWFGCNSKSLERKKEKLRFFISFLSFCLPREWNKWARMHQREVGHGENNDTLVLGCGFWDASQAWLQDVLAIEELLLGWWTHPNFVLMKNITHETWRQ